MNSQNNMSSHAFNNPGSGNFSNTGGGFKNPSHNHQPSKPSGHVPDSNFRGNQHQQTPVNQNYYTGQPSANHQAAGQSHAQPHNPSAQTDSDRDYRMIAAYAKRSALQFKPVGTRVSDSKKFSNQTIMIEGALRVDPNNPQNKAYDWGSKISIQVTMSELPIVIGVLLGSAPSCEFSSHGPKKDKSFNIENQGDKFFISVIQGGKSAVGVGVPLIDAMQVGHLALSQYLDNFPGINSETALRNISAMCNALNNANKFPLKKGR